LAFNILTRVFKYFTGGQFANVLIFWLKRFIGWH